MIDRLPLMTPTAGSTPGLARRAAVAGDFSSLVETCPPDAALPPLVGPEERLPDHGLPTHHHEVSSRFLAAQNPPEAAPGPMAATGRAEYPSAEVAPLESAPPLAPAPTDIIDVPAAGEVLAASMEPLLPTDDVPVHGLMAVVRQIHAPEFTSWVQLPSSFHGSELEIPGAVQAVTGPQGNVVEAPSARVEHGIGLDAQDRDSLFTLVDAPTEAALTAVSAGHYGLAGVGPEGNGVIETSEPGLAELLPSPRLMPAQSADDRQAARPVIAQLGEGIVSDRNPSPWPDVTNQVALTPTQSLQRRENNVEMPLDPDQTSRYFQRPVRNPDSLSFDRALKENTVLAPGHDPQVSAAEIPSATPVALESKGESQTPDGRPAEWVALPWKLQANAGLSYRGAGDVQSGSSTSSGPVGTAALAPGLAASRFVPQRWELLSEGRRLHRAFQHPLPTSAVQGVVANAESSVGEASASGHYLSLLVWPQRLLRWRDEGTGLTAWVRDYRLQPGDANRLIESLRCLADQQGQSLRRVMLNGHELWRSTH